MTLSKTTEYALRVLALMAGDDKKLHSSLELHKELKIPKKYLQRLLTDLSKNGKSFNCKTDFYTLIIDQQNERTNLK